MDTVISLLVLSALPQLVVPDAPSVTSFRAVTEMVSGDSRIFSGESIQLKCNIPDTHNSSWEYRWFRGSEQLSYFGKNLILWKSRVKDSGKYYCQGVRDTVVGKIRTLQSLPIEINVDGGWAILKVPLHPGLVGHTLSVTCRVRVGTQLHEVILYKDGVEVMRQNGLNPHFYLTRLTLWDQGMYSCRASWDTDRRTHSVISAATPVQVLEVLSQPILEIVSDKNLVPVNLMKLICHLQYNAPAPAPPLNYYFYKNNNRLGTATSENYDLVKRTPGQYRCRAKVPELDIFRWSEPTIFGQVTGPQVMMPPILRSRDQLSLAPPILLPDLSQRLAAEPTAAQPSPHQSTETPTFIEPTQMSIQSNPGPPLKPSQLAPSTLLSTVQSLYQTAIPNSYNTLGDTSGESGDMHEESGDMANDSPDTLLW
ncbi:high affinity immunoglobulin gamma Fc receptor I-like [Micropterus salmoides]|uniref:high affinity immunoglobulin gamma Fc receptor I-like n=1 Tax=Micropterus salmoides TaxID=27706 RepID=UPI0018EB867E|nr:high affinity immunoglobulin gamma Fc receptor I-like [Micropterus salmoides]ULE36159.1 Fc gamma receptor R1a [Micropterus salmoides]